MSVPAKNIIESSRDIVQDFLVPEMKAVKVSIEGLTHQIDSIQVEMKLREEKLEQLIRSGESRMELLVHSGEQRIEQLIRSGLERMEIVVRSGDDKNSQAIDNLSQKVDEKMEFRERLAALEARLPRQ